PALDRVRGRAAQDRDGEDPAVQAPGDEGVKTEGKAREAVAAWRREAREDPEGFWGRAAEQVRWSKKWERVLDWQPPTFRWYSGGMSNLAYNCVDHHVAAGHGERVALITENERGETRRFTYAELARETKRVSAALRGLGIGKGDRIAIYMPTSAEANEPAYILATSGTTAKPKLAVHTHGGYQVYVYSMGKWMFGLREDDVWWSTSDIGWVVGHSYIVFAPLLVGCTTIAYEGALDHPTVDTPYAIVERNR